MSRQNEQQQAYGFASKPRAVGGGPSNRYRKPMGLTLMSDRRVVRGSTHKPGNVAVPAAMHEPPPATRKKLRGSRGYIPPTKPSIFDLKPEQEDHIPVNLEGFLVEKEKVVSVVDIETQTDEFEDLPPPAPYVPKKTGVDVGTQVDLDELFNFDMEVGPILDVIVNKTLEQARMEVGEEEELRIIRSERRNYDVMHEAEQARVAKLEEQQRQKFRAKQERVARERERVAKEQTVYQKVGSVQLIKLVVAELQGRVYNDLRSVGFFPDMLEEEVKQDFMPWLYDAAAAISDRNHTARQMADDLIHNALAIADKRHRERKCYIRVVVNVGPKTHVVGPLVVASGDTVAHIHDRIANWLESRGTSTESLGGPIRLAYGSPPVPLESDQVLLSIRGLDLNELHVSVEVSSTEGQEGEENDE